MAIKLKQAVQKYQSLNSVTQESSALSDDNSPLFSAASLETASPTSISSSSASTLPISQSPSSPTSVPKKNPYISHPHQLRALQLSQKFNDPDHKIQYLNLCKSIHPTIIDQAESFVSDANANNKAALFMWKVKQIKLDWISQKKDWHHPDRSKNPSETHRSPSSSSKHSRATKKRPKKSLQKQPNLFS